MEHLKMSSEKYFHYDKEGDIEIKKLLDKADFYNNSHSCTSLGRGYHNRR